MGHVYFDFNGDQKGIVLTGSFIGSKFLNLTKQGDIKFLIK